MSDDLAALLAELDHEAEVVAAAYESAGRKRIAPVTVATFHCAARRSCTLLTVWRTPAGLMFYRPRYRNSPALNAAESNAEGREANTEDGERRWRARAGNLDRLRDWGEHAGMELNCDHAHTFMRMPDLLAVVDRGTPGAPTRCVVRS